MTKPRAGVRPTTRKVIESLFAILDGALDGWEGVHVLDAFAGSGQLGLEALERGAGSVTFIEKSAAAASDLRRTLCDEGHRSVTVIRGDAFEVLARLSQPFDLVFVDPPYSLGLAARALDVLATRGLIAPGGWVVAEHHHKDPMPAAQNEVVQVRQQRYGETALTFYRRFATNGSLS